MSGSTGVLNGIHYRSCLSVVSEFSHEKMREDNLKKIVFMAVLLLSSRVMAASQDECSIWLCMPAGFPPPMCDAARDAMKDRVEHGHSPLPSLSGCSVSSNGLVSGQEGQGDDVKSKDGKAAYIPPTKKCVSYKTERRGGKNGVDRQYCVKYENVPERYIKGTSCRRYNDDGTIYTDPEGCTKTVRWVEVWQGGAQIGSTYYW